MATDTRDVKTESAQDRGQCIRQAIARYIQEDPDHPDPEDARISGRRITVVNVVNALLYAGGDHTEVARQYEIDPEAVKAAVWFYSLHKDVIDVRIAEDAAPYETSRRRGWRL